MSQNLFLDPTVSSPPTLTPGSVGNGTLTIDKLSHFTINQNYTAVCTSIDPFTVFNIIGDLDGAVGVAVVGTQFIEQDAKVFLTIQQGPVLFAVGDTFEFSVEQGTDLNQANIDSYDELPQKNFGPGVIGQNSGDHNVRFNEAAQLAFREIQDLKFESKIAGALGNSISIEYLLGTVEANAEITIQDLTYTANLPGVGGNDIQIEYLQFDAAIAASATIQDILYSSKQEGTLGNNTSIEYIGGGIAGSEGVSVVGEKITVTIEDGVSTADQIRIAIGSNPTAFALLDGFSTGTGLEPQTIQAETFLTGGIDAVGDAGNEIVSVVGNLITVKLESGVSTAQNVYDAVFASPAALSLISPTITGTPATVQTAPVAATNLVGGADNNGLPGAEVVSVNGTEIQITFVDGLSTAQQIKTAVEASVEANALVSVTLLGLGTEFQSSPVVKTFLAGGLGVGTYSFNTKELSDAGNFFEGNATALVGGINNQGDEVTSGETTKKGKLTLDDSVSGNNSGPLVDNTQKTINNLIQNGKAIFTSENAGKVTWSAPALTLSVEEAFKIVFTETNIVNTIAAVNFPLEIADGEHLWVTVDRDNSVILALSQGTNVPTGENVFRIVSRIGTSLIWWDNTLHREGQIIRVGEGAGGNFYNEVPTGLINGVNTDFVITNEPIDGSLKVFLDGLLDMDFIYNSGTKTITMATAPELGQQIRAVYN